MLPLRRLEIRRHAERDPSSDRLSTDGIRQAYELGRSLRVGYTHLFTSGAQRATQTLACMIAAMGRVILHGVEVRPALLSPKEDEWRAAVRAAASSSLESIRAVNDTLVSSESERMAAALRAILAELPEGAYAVAIGHSPLLECGIHGLTHQIPPPLGNCEGFVISELKGGRLDVERASL